MQTETERKLSLMGKEIPKKLRDQLTYKTNEFAEQKAKLQNAMNDPRIPKDQAKFIERTLSNGLFDKEVERVNPKVEKKINHYLDQKIKIARDRGEIPSERQAREEYKRYVSKR